MEKLISALFFFLRYMLDSVISQPVSLPLGHAAPPLWSALWIQAPCLGWAWTISVHQAEASKTGLSHLSTWAWRNRRTDKTPNPKLINIKAPTSLCSPPSLSFHRPSAPIPNCFHVLSLTLDRSFYPLIINGRGRFTPLLNLLLFAHPSAALSVWAAQQEVVHR